MSASSLELQVSWGVPCEFPEGRASKHSAVPCTSETAASEEDQNHLLEPFIELMSQMKATRPQHLRGIRAFRVLQRAPCSWRRGRLHQLYALSEAAHELDEFWSHSWQTRPVFKYTNVLFLNNGLPAFAVGTLCAVVFFCLRASGSVSWQNLCVPCGAVGYYLTLLLWRRRKLVFLDAACIHQTDKTLKLRGAWK